MPDITYEDGTSITFDKTPSPQNIEDAYNQATMSKQNQSSVPSTAQDPNTSTQDTNQDPDVLLAQGLQQHQQLLSSGGSDASNNPSDVQTQKPDNSGALLNNLLQFGKSVYNNPLAHPILKAVSDATGSNAEQVYRNVGAPQGVMEKISSGVGSAVPLILATTPIGRGIDMILEGSSTLPVIGKLTSVLKDSELAKNALTGLTYGAAEGTAINAQGGNINVGEYAKNTAGQFLLWGALAKGGATLGAKFLPKDLPMAEQIVSNMPDSLKKAYTPEGLGSIAGGMAAGAMNAPDKQSGIAGAILGGAMSAFNPSEKSQFKEGMGKTMGIEGISAITDRWGVPFKIANNIIKKFGFNRIEAVGTTITPDGENAIHLAAKTQIDNYGKTWTDLHNATQPVLQEMDNKALSGIDTINMVNGIKSMIDNKFRTPGFLSKIKGAFDAAYPSLQAVDFPIQIAKKYGIAPENFKGDTFTTSISEVNKITDPDMKMRVMQAITKNQLRTGVPDTSGSFRNPLSKVSFQALDELRQTMNKIGQGNDPYESGVASKIAQTISNHMKMKSDGGNPGTGEYTKLMGDWSNLFKTGDRMGETQDYQKLAQKLSNPHWSQNDTVRRTTENNLEAVDRYFISKGKTPVKDIIDQYHAYNTYANPTQEGLTKTFPIRQIVGAASSALLTPVIGPAGATAGALLSWHMGSPEAWVPVLKGTTKKVVSK